MFRRTAVLITGNTLSRCQRFIAVERNTKVIQAISRNSASPIFTKWNAKCQILHDCAATENLQYDDSSLDVSESKKKKRPPKRLAPLLQDYARELMVILEVKEKEAKEIVSDINFLLQRDIKEFARIVEIIKLYEIGVDMVKRNLFIFWRNSDDVNAQLNFFVTRLNISGNAALPLLENYPVTSQYILSHLDSDTSIMNGDNRIHYFAMRMGVAPEVITAWMQLNPYLLKLEGKNLVALTDIALDEVNLSPRQVMSDAHFYKYSEGHVRERVELITKEQAVSVKAWMLRTSLKRIKTQMDNDRDYICRRSNAVQEVSQVLECEEHQAEVFSKLSNYKKYCRFTKLKEFSQLFEEFGLPKYFICDIPYILMHSPQKIRARLQQLQDRGFNVRELESNKSIKTILIQNNKTFNRFVRNSVSRSNSSKSE